MSERARKQDREKDNFVFFFQDQSYIVKPRKNSLFLKKGKTVILIENRTFSRSRMMKQTVPLNSSHEI